MAFTPMGFLKGHFRLVTSFPRPGHESPPKFAGNKNKPMMGEARPMSKQAAAQALATCEREVFLPAGPKSR